MAGSFDVFFSYATRDHTAVERVGRELTQRGVRVFSIAGTSPPAIRG